MGFQTHLLRNAINMPKSLRELYDLWVEVSEEHYAEFAMSEEYQALYGDMVNKLMVCASITAKSPTTCCAR